MAEAIDQIEEAYEFLLAYAARGVRREEDDPGSHVRDFLNGASSSLALIERTTVENLGGAGRHATDAAGKFLDVVRHDAANAGAAVRFVLAQPSIGSQIIDNLNASIHVRALLTDLFLLDEALKISGI